MKLKATTLFIVLFMATMAAKGQTTGKNDLPSSAIDTGIIVIAPAQMGDPDSSLSALYDSMYSINSLYKQNAVAIFHLLQNRELNNQTKYSLIKSNIINSSETYNLLNNAIVRLQSGFYKDSLDFFVSQLDNRKDSELGFSFNKKVIDLVKTIILRGKSAGSKNKRILASINSMVNDTLFKSNSKIVPPIEIISSVMTFLRSAAIKDKRIKTKNINKLQDALNKYVVYYSALNTGRRQFAYGLNVIQEELTTLDRHISMQLKFIANALDIPLPPWKTPASLNKELNTFFTNFNKPHLQQFFTNLEKKYTIPGTKQVNYERLLRENGNLKQVNNQLNDLVLQIKKFDNIDNEYFTLLESYYTQVVNSLSMASDSGLVDKKFIMDKQSALSKLKNKEFNELRKAINLNSLMSNTNNIKYRFKVF